MYQQVPYVLSAFRRTANPPPLAWGAGIGHCWHGPGLVSLVSQHTAINTEVAVTPERGQAHNAMGSLPVFAAVTLVSAPRVSDANSGHAAEAQGHGQGDDLS